MCPSPPGEAPVARPDMTTARPGVANAIRTQMPRQRVPPTAVSRATVGWCANAVSALGGDCDRRRPIVCEAIWARSRHGAWEVGKRVYNSRACRRCARRKEAEGEAAGQEAAHGRACRHQAVDDEWAVVAVCLFSRCSLLLAKTSAGRVGWRGMRMARRRESRLQ